MYNSNPGKNDCGLLILSVVILTKLTNSYRCQFQEPRSLNAFQNQNATGFSNEFLISDNNCNTYTTLLPSAHSLVGVVKLWAGEDQLRAGLHRVDQRAAVLVNLMCLDGWRGNRIDNRCLMVNHWSLVDNRLDIFVVRQKSLDDGSAVVIGAALMRYC